MSVGVGVGVSVSVGVGACLPQRHVCVYVCICQVCA